MNIEQTDGWHDEQGVWDDFVADYEDDRRLYIAYFAPPEIAVRNEDAIPPADWPERYSLCAEVKCYDLQELACFLCAPWWQMPHEAVKVVGTADSSAYCPTELEHLLRHRALWPGDVCCDLSADKWTAYAFTGAESREFIPIN